MRLRDTPRIGTTGTGIEITSAAETGIMSAMNTMILHAAVAMAFADKGRIRMPGKSRRLLPGMERGKEITDLSNG